VYRDRVRVLWTVLLVTGCGFKPQGVTADGQNEPDAVAGRDAKGFEDAPCADDDHDGVCNDADSWPCGVNPAAIPNQVELTDNGGATDFKLTQIAIDGHGTLVTAMHSTNLRIQLHYVATDSACMDCRDQLEVGFDPVGDRLGCVFDTDVPKDTTQIGDINNTSFDVPSAPGVYDLHIHIGQKLSCDDNGTGYYGGSEGPDVIAKLCVE
jgi:hypothetical protein